MERRTSCIARWVALSGLVLSTAGCSISDSSESLSDSISSPSEWSSDSSKSSSGGDSAYRRDVSDYTVAFASAGHAVPGDLDAFRSGLRRMAEERGVSDWEADALTCAGIGAGLQRAALDPASAEAFGRRLLGPGAAGLVALRDGYAAIP